MKNYKTIFSLLFFLALKSFHAYLNNWVNFNALLSTEDTLSDVIKSQLEAHKHITSDNI